MEKEGQETPSKELSKTIQAMKFMQRKKEAELREKLRLQQEEEVKKTHWAIAEYYNQPSVTIEQLGGLQWDNEGDEGDEEEHDSKQGIAGRMSFRQFNPQIEQLKNKGRGNSKKGTHPIADTSMEDSADVSAKEAVETFAKNKRRRNVGEEEESNKEDVSYYRRSHGKHRKDKKKKQKQKQY